MKQTVEKTRFESNKTQTNKSKQNKNEFYHHDECLLTLSEKQIMCHANTYS